VLMGAVGGQRALLPLGVLHVSSTLATGGKEVSGKSQRLKKFLKG